MLKPTKYGNKEFILFISELISVPAKKPAKKGLKLWVPKAVSTSPLGRTQQKGTKAFVLKGTRLKKGTHGKTKALRKIAHEAQYYTKPFSARTKKVRDLLEKNGIRTEKLM